MFTVLITDLIFECQFLQYSKKAKFNGYYEKNFKIKKLIFRQKEQFLKDVKKKFDVETTKKKLIDVCLTRWVVRTDGVVVFETFFIIIVYALE